MSYSPRSVASARAGSVKACTSTSIPWASSWSASTAETFISSPDPAFTRYFTLSGSPADDVHFPSVPLV